MGLRAKKVTIPLAIGTSMRLNALPSYHRAATVGESVTQMKVTDSLTVAARIWQNGEKNNDGFTLIEILIVMLIMGIVLSIALLSISHNRKKELEDTATTLIHMLTLLETESLLRPATLGLRFTPEGYQFLIADDKNSWQPFTDSPFGFHALPQSLRPVLKMQAKDTPRIIISENGNLTPFTLLLYDQDEVYSIKGDANGEVRRDAVTD